MKPKLNIQFSGGRTSAVMTRVCLDQFKHTHDMVVTFENTGCEHPATLEFVKACDDNWGFNTVWIEAVVGPARVGIRHKVVTFETASRNGEPYEAYIEKYGLPSTAIPTCTARLKTEAVQSYLKSIGWVRGKKLNYSTAIGIRVDESDRISSKMREERYVYPLIKAGITKEMVLADMAQYSWDLKLPGEHYGNCVWCFKKSLRKLMTVAKNTPEAFDFPRRMEAKFQNFKADKFPRRFFRGNKTVEDIFEMAKQPFEEYKDKTPPLPGSFDAVLDIGSGCSESCEIGADQ